MNQSLIPFLGARVDEPALKDAIVPLGPPELLEMEDSTDWIFEAHGIELGFDERGTLSHIHFFSRGRDGFAEYTGSLPLGVTFKDTRDTLLARLGTPVREVSQEERRRGSPEWLRYMQGSAVIHIELGKRNKVSLVTAMTQERARD